PTAADEDCLERQTMEMNPVGDRAAIRDRNMRGDIAASQSAGNEVPVHHTGAPLRRRAASARQHELGFECREIRWQRRGIRRLQEHGFPSPTERRPAGIVSRKDGMETKAVALQIVDSEVQVLADYLP